MRKPESKPNRNAFAAAPLPVGIGRWAIGLWFVWLISQPLLPTCAARSAAAGFRPQASEKKSKLTPDARDRIRRSIASVGIILVRDPANASTPLLWRRGSGVIVRKDGIVVTNYHVISMDKVDRLFDDIYFSLAADGEAAQPRSYRLEVALVSKTTDLALLRIVTDNEGKAIPASATFSSLEIGDSGAVRELDELIIIGFPESGGPTVTINPGLVEGKNAVDNWIKTNARLIHGNSGGAAVNSEGKLIGIPTKVVRDEQPVDTDGDGFPDQVRTLGEIGFLRPAQLVGTMLAQLGNSPPATVVSGPGVTASASKESPGKAPLAAPTQPPTAVPAPAIIVRGVIKSVGDGLPIAGARVGLVPKGSEDVTPKNLLTWGSTNAEGKFELNNPVPAGRYTLRAKSFRYETVTCEVEIIAGGPQLLIEMRVSQADK